MNRSEGISVICTVDVVLLTLHGGQLCVVLLKRERPPFQGALALPGGYIHPEQDQDAVDAAARVLLDKTGLASPYLEQLATFSGPGRDPRGWSVSIAYYALVPQELLRRDTTAAQVLPVEGLPVLPFDHGRMVAAAVARVRSKSQYSSLPVHLCPERFTLPQLQAVYEAVLGEPINKVSFRRKVEELDVLEPLPGELEQGRANRPAQLYRLRPQYRRSLSLLERGIGARS
ncbi:NUDIX hydrolase [Aquabacterium sp. A7-Y]|uniref:NUDIX hydrolase n=1 Tax=Aquabacterium sp. A7-Y TaxID=1349605 RepID=UPI00223D1112|nr:NUDIX domain-containing protein [Aquabacterium sp. A7-Y]MCW7539254.1 NUDIX hydrolase [Aquabacterium sp. A7-Y]